MTVRIRHAEVVAVPDERHVTVTLDGAQVNAVLLAGLTPEAGQIVTVLQEGRRLVVPTAGVASFAYHMVVIYYELINYGGSIGRPAIHHLVDSSGNVWNSTPSVTAYGWTNFYSTWGAMTAFFGATPNPIGADTTFTPCNAGGTSIASLFPVWDTILLQGMDPIPTASAGGSNAGGLANPTTFTVATPAAWVYSTLAHHRDWTATATYPGGVPVPLLTSVERTIDGTPYRWYIWFDAVDPTVSHSVTLTRSNRNPFTDWATIGGLA